MIPQSKNIVSYNLKLEYFLTCSKFLLPYLKEKSSKNNNIKYILAVESLERIEKNKVFCLKDCFNIYFSLLLDFEKLMNNRNSLNLNKLLDQKIWDSGQIDLDMSIYFSYTFVYELYKEEIDDIVLNMNSKNDIKGIIDVIKFVNSNNHFHVFKNV